MPVFPDELVSDCLELGNDIMGWGGDGCVVPEC